MIVAVGATPSSKLDARTTHLICAHGDALDERRRLPKLRASLGPGVKKMARVKQKLQEKFKEQTTGLVRSGRFKKE